MPSRRAQAHARHGFYCSCGKIVHGNGAKHMHREMHRRHGDGHRYISMTAYREQFRRCSACRGVCRWAEDWWVCEDCGSEWNEDYGPEYALEAALSTSGER